MDLREMLGEKFREEMTASEIAEALADKKLVDLSTGKYTNTENYNALEKKLKETEARNAEFLKQKKQAMSEDEQRAERERETTEMIAGLKKNNCRLVMERELASAGFDPERREQLIGIYQTDDPEKAVEFAKNIAEIRKADQEAIRLALKEEAMAAMQKPNAGKSESSTQNLTLTEQMQKANDNPAALNEILSNLQKKG